LKLASRFQLRPQSWRQLRLFGGGRSFLQFFCQII